MKDGAAAARLDTMATPLQFSSYQHSPARKNHSMSITSTLLKLGAPLALAHLASRIRMADLQKLTHLGGDDLKRHGLDRADSALGTIGLRRIATMTSSTSLVLGGFVAGAVVGGGALFLFHTEQGAAVRRQVIGFFTRGEVDHEPIDEPPAAAPHDGGNTSPTVPENVEVLTV
jgi:hypothetical protein